MKNGRIILSIFVLLFIFQVADAVECRASTGMKQCSSTCVIYKCPDIGTTKVGFGCPEDFYSQCSTQTAAIQLIQSKNPNEMDYDYSVGTVLYTSGCGNENNGVECLKNKMISANNAKVAAVDQRKYGRDTVWWRTPDCSSDDESKCPSGASKNIGIFSIGWMLLFAAAWIY